MSLVIDKFPWGSEQVKMKGALASFMCDLVLDKEDFQNLKEWKKNGGDLEERLKLHPEEVANKLKQNRSFVPHETITIVEQHHERPNGSGFPHGITSKTFNPLSAIFIVCQEFTEKLQDSEYDFEKKAQIISELYKELDCSTSIFFRKAMSALEEVLQ